MRRLFLRPAHGTSLGSGLRILHAAEPEGLPLSENPLTERGPPGTVKSLKRPSPDRPSMTHRGAGRHPAGNHEARRMLTPPARVVPLLPFKRAPASWAEQTNAPGVHTPAPGNKRRLMPRSLHLGETTPCSRPEFFSRTNSRRVGSVCRRSRPSPPPLRPESRPASKDVFRENAARSKTSHAHAQRSRAVRHPHAVP